ncbi:MFS transporter [Variovorax sp. LjRoot130]|uniref:MFS transporter n=1 Tax=Variovorax sp. LjRoot130 TaxID=3342261 RepID=UPI003ECCCF04
MKTTAPVPQEKTMIKTDSTRGRIGLMVAHCAGMLDTVALPVWVGTLVAAYHFDPQQAGLLVTLFLGGVVVASVLLAPRFNRLSGRAVSTLGFLACALGFGAASLTTDFVMLALVHALCGAATGAALSVTHGTIALSARPHRLFAIVNTALGIAAVFYLGITPQIVAKAGGPALFLVFGAVMALAALVSLFAFPSAETAPAAAAVAGAPTMQAPARFGRAVWFGIAGIALVTVTQAMVFSFVERVGNARGFGAEAVAGVLIALGFVNLLPAPLAALLERRLPARLVLVSAPVVQAALAVTVMNTTAFFAYGAAASVIVAVAIFSHTFAFGLLARLEPTGRALSATPAMLMTGAAIGPVLGGTLIKFFGYGSLGIAAIVLCCGAVLCYSRLPRQSAAAPRPTPAPAQA